MYQYADEEVYNVLRNARALIARGWCQHKAQIGDKYCIVGAIFQADTGSSFYSRLDGPAGEAMTLLMHQLPWQPHPNHLPEEWASQMLPKFNDDPSTSQEDVLNVFDKAIANLGES